MVAYFAGGVTLSDLMGSALLYGAALRVIERNAAQEQGEAPDPNQDFEGWARYQQEQAAQDDDDG